MATFHDDYYISIEQNRANLNHGYECPKSNEVIYDEMKKRGSSTKHNILDDNVAGNRRTFTSFKRDSAIAEVYEEPLTASAKLTYDEFPVNIPNEYDTVRKLN